MGMPALYVTVLSAIVLTCAEVQDWTGFTILGIVFLASVAIAYSAKKYSIWANSSMLGFLALVDGGGRWLGDTPSSLHNSMTFADLIYTSLLFAAAGWIGGWMLRGPQENAENTPMARPEPESVMARSPFAAPARSRRRTA